ncbi:MAG: TonB-dependent receptor [Saprospiraceae bacterium]|nr:TonB-dependent receptor [Saprospiraceae bacterium]
MPSQTIRGTVVDADNARPLAGATILLLDTAPALGNTVEMNGQYQITDVPVGRYRMQVSFVGYETVTIAEVLVEAGKETVQDVQLRERGEALQEVVVKAQGRGSADLHPVSVHTITVEEQFRFPATYYDPARVAMSFPGVAGENDGTNIISVRGNSPNALQWRLEGVAIVNPNHTANAGTFSDRPTQAAGGVNILSAQLLSTSNFLTGAFPAEYGNSLGGILDMRLRRGNDHEREFTVQAGFIGIEAAIEGPFKQRTTNNEQQTTINKQRSTPSYLANYRYSFTGLLTAMGADFGDEATAFHDFSFHVSLPAKKAGHFSIFGLYGNSSTVFDSPKDSALITEDKEQFNIDFTSVMSALGATHILPVGKKGVWKTAVALSGLEHTRTADLVDNQTEPARWERDFLKNGKTAVSSTFSQKINSRLRWDAGIQASYEDARFSSFFTTRANILSDSGNVKGWLWQPYLEGHFRISPKLNMTLGLHLAHFTFSTSSTSLEPRASLVFSPNSRQRISLAYGLHSQLQLTQLYVYNETLGFTKSHHAVAGYHRVFGKSLIFNGEIYYQRLFDVPVARFPGSTFSALNLTDFSLGFLANSENELIQVGKAGKGRNYGLELSLQQFISNGYYFILSSSLYRSEYTGVDGTWHSTRFDGKYIFNLTGGKEFSKQKTTKKGKQKVVVKGVNARAVWYGGYRDTPIDLAASEALGRTVYQAGEPFSLKQEDYYRLDLRLYLKWNKTGRNSTLSLDLQNVTGRKNAQYSYYDSVQDKVLVKRQLGLIPILSWRMAF